MSRLALHDLTLSMIPFYCAVCIHALYIPLYYFLLPESLSTEARRHLRKMAKISRLAEKRRDALEREWEDEDPERVEEMADNGIRSVQTGHSKRRKKFFGNARRFMRRITRFARPLQVFMPTERPDGTKDYNLTLIGLGMFVTSLMMVRVKGGSTDSAGQHDCKNAVCLLLVWMDVFRSERRDG